MPDDLADFTSLLETNAEDAVRPPPQPSGTYRVLIHKANQVRSGVKKTPGIEFELTNWDPLSDVDSDAWAAYREHPMIDADKISRMETFWMSKKSLYRLKDFCILAGSNGEGQMGKLVADIVGNTVLAKLVQTPGEGDAIYNEVQEFVADDQGV
jgi:hypothetical protein